MTERIPAFTSMVYTSGQQAIVTIIQIGTHEEVPCGIGSINDVKFNNVAMVFQ
jgi:hypothetical protein